MIKKAYLQILKNLAQFFWSFLFSNIKKHTYKSEKTWRNFLLISFSNIKKAYLQILKNLTQFFAYPFFKYYKS